MRGRNPTAEERRFMAAMCELGCLVCRKFYLEITECSFHHMDGRTKPGAHLHGIGLCGKHHQIADTKKPKRWISRHGDGKAAFEAEYGTELELYHYALGLMND